jgi:hypothetical protein
MMMTMMMTKMMMMKKIVSFRLPPRSLYRSTRLPPQNLTGPELANDLYHTPAKKQQRNAWICIDAASEIQTRDRAVQHRSDTHQKLFKV